MSWLKINSEYTNSELSQNHTEKQIMSSKATINWLFNDKCNVFIACFDWKIGVFQQTVVKIYYILNTNYFVSEAKTCQLIDISKGNIFLKCFE